MSGVDVTMSPHRNVPIGLHHRIAHLLLKMHEGAHALLASLALTTTPSRRLFVGEDLRSCKLDPPISHPRVAASPNAATTGIPSPASAATGEHAVDVVLPAQRVLARTVHLPSDVKRSWRTVVHLNFSRWIPMHERDCLWNGVAQDAAGRTNVDLLVATLADVKDALAHCRAQWSSQDLVET